MRVDFNGKMATIRAIGAGRVLLDFNPPLAGKTLIYDVTVDKKLETSEEKIAVLIHRRIPVVEAEKIKFTIKEKTLAIDMPEETFYVEGIQIAKRGIAMDLQKLLPEFTEIKFVETFRSEPKPDVAPEPKTEPTPKPKPKAKAKPQAKTKQKQETKS
jgi:peptidylprolyl isomerase